jgi:hypothetical protein
LLYWPTRLEPKLRWLVVLALQELEAMSDIVERLRDKGMFTAHKGEIIQEAATEIERLRAELAEEKEK